MTAWVPGYRPAGWIETSRTKMVLKNELVLALWIRKYSIQETRKPSQIDLTTGDYRPSLRALDSTSCPIMSPAVPPSVCAFTAAASCSQNGCQQPPGHHSAFLTSHRKETATSLSPELNPWALVSSDPPLHHSTKQRVEFGDLFGPDKATVE